MLNDFDILHSLYGRVRLSYGLCFTHNQQWLVLAQTSFEWLLRLLEISGHQGTLPSDWTSCVPIIRSSPGTWKAWIRRAKNTSLLLDRWSAEVQTYHGLLLRRLRLLGAVTSLSQQDSRSHEEICAACSQRFRNLREWSHHAFKRHGRVRPERRLVSGTQCPVCLRQFASNGRLCNHLRHSSSCRDSLISEGHEVVPLPGKGSKLYDSGHDALVPVLQAAGPLRPWERGHVVPEPEQPSQSMLDELTDSLCSPDDSVTCLAQLLESFRHIFSRECLQLSRLQATAREWQEQLSRLLSYDEEWPIQWATLHAKAAAYLLEVDFVQWLVGDSEPSCEQHSTFRDAAIVLPWLDFTCVGLPALDEVRPVFSRVFASKATSCRPFCIDNFVALSILKSEPGRLDFSTWADASVSDGVSLFSVVGLVGSLEAPRPATSFAVIETALQNLRLFSDLVRGTLFLWSKGLPAILVATDFGCPGLGALKAIAPHKADYDGNFVLANFAFCSVFSSCFTLSN